MRLDDAPESSNVSDNRGMGGKLALGGGAGGILLVVLGLIFGVDLGGGQRAAGPPGEAPKDGYDKFARQVLGTTEAVWAEQFKTHKYENGKYVPPKMVLFSEGVQTKGCGSAPSSVGPFYCPADQTVYLDPTFFDELEKKLGGSKAEFSQAYVIGHEVGHHVQNLLGYSARTDAKRKSKQENEFSIRLELQADYLAGVWAHHADKKYKIIEKGDVEEALKSARDRRQPHPGEDEGQELAGEFQPRHRPTAVRRVLQRTEDRRREQNQVEPVLRRRTDAVQPAHRRVGQRGAVPQIETAETLRQASGLPHVTPARWCGCSTARCRRPSPGSCVRCANRRRRPRTAPVRA